SESELALKEGGAAVIGLIAKPFMGPAFGTYTVQLEIGNRRYRYPVHIEKAPKNKGGRASQ
ncbi:MAG TPA: hypothetical protein VGL87_15190, partial [Steroidobacteraceae bacterium]